VHQHVRRFYTNTNNTGDQSDHRVWSITGRLLHTLQACKFAGNSGSDSLLMQFGGCLAL
jgi:hypothetical protein